MRVLLVASDFKPRAGGIAEYSHQLMSALHAAGGTVRVVAPAHPEAAEFDRSCPYPVTRIPTKPRQERGLFDNLAAWRTLSGLVREHRPQALLGNSVFAEPLLLRLLAWRHGVPYGVFAYGREITTRPHLARRLGAAARLKKRVKTAAWERADRVLCISSFTAELLASTAVSKNRIAIVPPGATIPRAGSLDLALIARLRERWEGRRVMLSLGRLVARKGADTAISAMVHLQQTHPDALLVIVGEGPCRDALEGQARELGLERHVVFAGAVSEPDKWAYLSAADLFVMPNRATADGDVEGFGITFLEANAVGLPVIGGRSGGVPDAVVEGETGLLIDPEDVSALTQAMAQLLDDRELARRLGRTGQQRVLQQLSWAAAARRLADAFAKPTEAGP